MASRGLPPAGAARDRSTGRVTGGAFVNEIKLGVLGGFLDGPGLAGLAEPRKSPVAVQVATVSTSAASIGLGPFLEPRKSPVAVQVETVSTSVASIGLEGELSCRG